ncbi:MAG: hypothetical protein LKI58_07390 [Actinomyces sp.]|jgi:hypothetical protein|nr:hypothetical protein [Actinomyces sp.]MCI1662926.1 hypothetical protein [Actinomyces sp.]MCI1787874.1 hypothetical protein [Actinomyces sp.]MCI1829790.1 hypothetical protein [Actinomyces sp.]MCI1866666.1 hypothetical protein [Actinomyces sp.]
MTIPFRAGQAVDVHTLASSPSSMTPACAGWVPVDATVQVIGNRPRMAQRLEEAA